MRIAVIVVGIVVAFVLVVWLYPLLLLAGVLLVVVALAVPRLLARLTASIAVGRLPAAVRATPRRFGLLAGSGLIVLALVGAGLAPRPAPAPVTLLAPAGTVVPAATSEPAASPTIAATQEPRATATPRPPAATAIPPTPAATPTARPEATATPPAPTTVTITSSANGNVTIQGPVGARCTLTVRLPSGTMSSGADGERVIDSQYRASWNWNLPGNTRSGTGLATVTCQPGGTVTAPFEVR
jgi:hypothetical protein